MDLEGTRSHNEGRVSIPAYTIERTSIGTGKTRVKLGPENLVKVTFNGINGKVEID